MVSVATEAVAEFGTSEVENRRDDLRKVVVLKRDYSVVSRRKFSLSVQPLH